MPQNQEVTPLNSPNLEAEQVSSDQGDIKILKDNLEAVMHNIYFNELQHRVVQLRRVPTPDVYVSPTKFEEKVIVSYVCKNPSTLVDATKAYSKSTSSSV